MLLRMAPLQTLSKTMIFSDSPFKGTAFHCPGGGWTLPKPRFQQCSTRAFVENHHVLHLIVLGRPTLPKHAFLILVLTILYNYVEIFPI